MNARLNAVVQYFKGEPNVHMIRYRRGKIVDHGPGLAFWYLPFNTSIASVPIVTQDAPFIFNEATRDFQAVAIQGSLTYRLTDPLSAAKLLDFTIAPATGRYKGKDPEKLAQRLINAVQTHTRSHVIERSLQDALTQVKDLACSDCTAVGTGWADQSHQPWYLPAKFSIPVSSLRRI